MFITFQNLSYFYILYVPVLFYSNKNLHYFKTITEGGIIKDFHKNGNILWPKTHIIFSSMMGAGIVVGNG